MLAIPLAALTGACASGGAGGGPSIEYQHVAEYRVSCSVSDECRVQFIDEGGELRARDIVGEWTHAIGIDSGSRMWVRASSGGCPPRPLRVEIFLGTDPVAETTQRAEHRTRCDWLMAETEFTVP